MKPLTKAQKRLLAVIEAYQGPDGEGAEYWPVVNDWLNDRGNAGRLALHNSERTIDILIKGEYITLDDDGLLKITEKGKLA